MERTRR